MFVAFIGLLANMLRFQRSIFLNKLIFSLAALAAAECAAFYFGTENLLWMLPFFIVIAGFSFWTPGGVTSAAISTVLVMVQTSHNFIGALIGYLFIGILSGQISNDRRRSRSDAQRWTNMLLNQSKHLQVFREVSATMQRTLHQEMLLKVILTSVTAGHGLGFNRAMIFLVSKDSQSLQGSVGVGPMDVGKGYEVWEKITEDKLRLRDLIKHNFDSNFTDPQLNDILATLDIPFNEEHVFGRTLANQKPIIVKSIDTRDPSQVLMNELFKSEEFALVPLMNQGKNIGVLFIDNIVNKRPITLLDTENLMPLANQAAVALDHARLYEQIEEMALRDGLTGLLNQRAFQSILEEHFSFRTELSLVILDIDFFKVFNDKNGHLLGNEVLRKLAGVVSDTISDKGFSFRFGGEEFVVLLPDTSIEIAEDVAEKIRMNVEHTEFPGERSQPNGKLTISVGVASTAHPGIFSENQLIEAADQALYEAKRRGKNAVVPFKEFVAIE